MAGDDEPPEPADRLRAKLGAWLRAAMARRDTVAIAALRSLMAVLDNAGAVSAPGAEAPEPGEASEAPRRRLSPDELERIVEREIAERREAALDHQRTGALLAAARLRREIAIIEGLFKDAALRSARGS